MTNVRFANRPPFFVAGLACLIVQLWSNSAMDLFRRWIVEGANYQAHWAFQPPQRPAIPAVKNVDWPRNHLDRFVLAELEKQGLSPSTEADPLTLLRRMTLDLTGLPPTLAEIDAFLADRSGSAYANSVERLLESPHYGERWGRIWLDGARYADSDGYEKDSRLAWNPESAKALYAELCEHEVYKVLSQQQPRSAELRHEPIWNTWG